MFALPEQATRGRCLPVHNGGAAKASQLPSTLFVPYVPYPPETKKKRNSLLPRAVSRSLFHAAQQASPLPLLCGPTPSSPLSQVAAALT